MRDSLKRFETRKAKVRKKIFGTADKPRLSIYRGHKHIYAQLIDDEKGVTLAAASTLAEEIKSKLKSCDTIVAAKAVGEAIAKKAVGKGIKKAVFDRGGHLYHGRVKAIADAAREAGLEI
ncbi:MAG TPA: 50S ribosomal protein L18 [Elusimicrobia bacterium]|nr:MAG: 50S ribosomal protein L18 [Elusimicrobia bacterium RIFOXYA12_FULL_49_49]OGS06140.1 MAG: 50S ribosomal protein L18 [Elusimicrobia bacterium RIFOXYA1_FULL_47_7]OGS09423.1 MAG: 50S ribosomal protein L18 [Elusimicrobia bacterium RIFOXYB1_FULL_48_9]OGS14603.1 MAG: 50S ribosomal protein L18 [Elusimicrobia bacterium RIFOXYA2_FULL_47_53]OGS25744.1 MAG: 50S ribosomal protein L18 [Elusimicrobia bacterium RIFOXYB12_FULL_50_12]OGS31694.1 MAG: 50S ribosomal protein L18 [Elusimicrobia bacterium RIFO